MSKSKSLNSTFNVAPALRHSPSPPPADPGPGEDPYGLSLIEFPLYEKERLVNSPRSVEACKMEGISPRDLLFV